LNLFDNIASITIDTELIFWVFMAFDEQLDSLVRNCKKGRNEAFEELFELYQPRLKYYVRRLNGTGTNTEDILQDVWLTVIRKIRRLKNAQSFPVWLYRIARNKIYSGSREKIRFTALPEEQAGEQFRDDNEPELTADDAARLHEALNNIQPYHREVLTLLFIEQMSYKAIAEIIGSNIGTVRSRIYYAKKSLRKEMDKYNG